MSTIVSWLLIQIIDTTDLFHHDQQHLANTIVNTMGQRCMEPLREASESSEEVGHGLRAEGTCMGLLVGLSVHLKEKYSIRAEKMRKFSEDVFGVCSLMLPVSVLTFLALATTCSSCT